MSTNFIVIYVRGGMVERVLSTGTCNAVVVDFDVARDGDAEPYAEAVTVDVDQVATRAIHSRFVA